MSYLGGQHVQAVLDDFYPKKEAGIFLTCQKCRIDVGFDLPHSTSDATVVAAARRKGWSCTDTGHEARCPKCQREEKAAKVGCGSKTRG